MKSGPALHSGPRFVTLSSVPSFADDSRLYALLAADSAPVGLVVLGRDGLIRHVNQTLATLLDASPGFLTGRPLAQYVPDMAQMLEPLVEAVRERGRPRRVAGLALPLPRNLSEMEGPSWDVCCAPLPMDPVVATVAPDAVALWLWPEDSGTVASRQTMQTLRDALADTLPPDLPGFDVAAALVPSEPGAALGGDTYDVVRLENDCWALFVADVAGRGPAAAARAILVRHSARVLVTRHAPGESLTALSRLLLADTSFSGFVTAFLGVLNTRTQTLTFAFAGHEPVLVLRGDSGVVESLSGAGDLPLAVDDAAHYEDRTTAFTSRDTLLLYTDGLTDTRREADAAFFDEERLRESLLRHRHLPAGALVATLLAEAAEFAGARPLRDDTALLAVCGTGS